MVREKSAGVLMKRLAMVSLLFSCVHVFLYAQSAPVVSDIPDQTVQEDAPFLAINLNAYVSVITSYSIHYTKLYDAVYPT